MSIILITLESVLCLNLQDAKDAYEKLLDSSEKFEEVCSLLKDFVNSILVDFEFGIEHLQDLAGSGLLIILIGTIGQFYVPLHKFHLEPLNQSERAANAKCANQLLSYLDIDTSKVTEEGGLVLTIDLLNGELKALARVLFYLQQKVM